MTTVKTTHECVWTRTEVSDGGVGRMMADLRDADPCDVVWQSDCDELCDSFEAALRRQVPCAMWHVTSGTITACYAHVRQIELAEVWAAV